MRRASMMIETASLAAVLFYGALGSVAAAQTSDPEALAGQVSSSDEGLMEGVLVSAKREDSTVTITVVSNSLGRYSFPRRKLEPGRYALRIRAVGYDLNDPGPVEVGARKTTQLDLKLRKTQDLASQLNNAEWFTSMPGDERQKRVFFECVTCHTLDRIVRSRYTASEFPGVLQRMRNNMNRAGDTVAPRPERAPSPITTINPQDLDYLSSINLSKASTWNYPFKTIPRPKGKATRVIITEYDLPRPKAEPHDVVVGPEGMVWYCDFKEQYIGRLNPSTGKVVEYPVPQVKPGSNTGMNDLEIDREGTIWLALFNQPGLAKFDRKTEKFQTWSIPKELDSPIRRTVFQAPLSHDVDGKVWLGGGMDREYRIDLQSGKWEVADERRDVPMDSPWTTRPHGIYGLTSDSKNNLYEFDIASEYIVKVDAKTLKATFYQTPTLESGPRRGHMNSKDQLLFAEHSGNKVAMFDTKTERFEEWAAPTPFSNPYDAIMDKNEEVWTGGMTSDRILRLNPKNRELTEYLLPRSTNVRRVDVDNSTTPVTFWVGNNNAASIVRLEPLE
jgi:virginiamycin B lyase